MSVAVLILQRWGGEGMFHMILIVRAVIRYVGWLVSHRLGNIIITLEDCINYDNVHCTKVYLHSN